MYRVPLFTVTPMDSCSVGSYSVVGVPVMDIHEILAGKLAALFSRHAGRDLYDAHRLLTFDLLDVEKLRLAFVIYGAINREDWRKITVDNVGFDVRELESQLIPVLSCKALAKIEDRYTWAKRLVDECRERLSIILPLRKTEMDFLDQLLDAGEIRADLLTDDPELIEAISKHPGLLWKALNVKNYRFRG